MTPEPAGLGDFLSIIIPTAIGLTVIFFAVYASLQNSRNKRKAKETYAKRHGRKRVG